MSTNNNNSQIDEPDFHVMIPIKANEMTLEEIEKKASMIRSSHFKSINITS